MGILIRVVIAVIAFVVTLILIPLVLGELGVPVSDNLMAIIKICAAAVALIYIWRGPTPNWKPAP